MNPTTAGLMYDARLIFGNHPDKAFDALLRRYLPDLSDRSLAAFSAKTGVKWPTGKDVLWHDVWNLCAWVAGGQCALRPEEPVPSAWERLAR